MLHGQTEGRLYRNTLPIDFDAAMYRIYNSDLAEFNSIWLVLERHYQTIGYIEQRKYLDPLFDWVYFIRLNRIESYQGYIDYLRDIRQFKSQYVTQFCTSIQPQPGVIVLVSHDNSLFGATHFLYTLYGLLTEHWTIGYYARYGSQFGYSDQI